jgi:molybdenum cofactor synthesis domain-containing protein
VIRPGEFAENITTKGLSLSSVGVLDHLLVGEAELVVSQIGKECHGESCAIFREVGKCVMPKQGIFCKVVRSGRVHPGSFIEHQPRPLKVEIFTMSDRASRGEYEDRSGPQVESSLNEFFAGTRWHPAIHRRILPDDADVLRKALDSVEREGADVIIITGGTGIGPRDITPEVVSAFCEKTIPGIMESIRLKYGTDNPKALLSRGVAGSRGSLLVYAIPGSPRAALEYMTEIVKTMEHAFLMLQGVDAH